MNGSRVMLVLLLLAVTTGATSAARMLERRVNANLDRLPYVFDQWNGTNASPVDEDTARVLGADAYLTRTYQGDTGVPVDLYMAFYARQRPGVSIHSPLHCLPGNGWEPLDVATLAVAGADGRGARVRRMIIRKNLDRAVVLYWYAVHGRALASEVESKLWLLHDAVRLHRTDAALVRIVVPVGESVEAAEREAVSFTRGLLPYVARLWS